MACAWRRLCDILQPSLEPGQQGFLDLAFTADGALIEDAAHVWQFGLSLVRAEGVGKTGALVVGAARAWALRSSAPVCMCVCTCAPVCMCVCARA